MNDDEHFQPQAMERRWARTVAGDAAALHQLPGLYHDEFRGVTRRVLREDGERLGLPDHGPCARGRAVAAQARSH